MRRKAFLAAFVWRSEAKPSLLTGRDRSGCPAELPRVLPLHCIRQISFGLHPGQFLGSGGHWTRSFPLTRTSSDALLRSLTCGALIFGT